MSENEFAVKLEKHKNTVYRLAFSYLKNKEDAEDVTQEAFLKLFRCAQEFETTENEKAWLIRVTVNLCKNRFRILKLKRTVPLDENMVTDGIYMQSDLETLDLLSCIASKYRTVIYLFYYERYTTREIAKIFGKNENTIRTQLARGREKLKEILNDTEIIQKGGVIYEQQV